MQVRKRFGQHFLHDPGIIRRIVDAIAPVPGERLVEVGPGRGALTWGLLARAGTMDVIEIDRDLAAALAADPRAGAGLRIHVENVLQTDFIALRGAGTPLRIVGNLPYNISTPLLFLLLKQRAAIADMHFMLQKEVVDRMVAPPGGKEYGRLTVMLAAYAEVEALFDVGPGAFQPPPRVRSAIVRLRPAQQAALRHRRRGGAAHADHGGLLAAAQDPAKRHEEPAHRRTNRGLRHRSGPAAGNSGAGAVRLARSLLQQAAPGAAAGKPLSRGFPGPLYCAVMPDAPKIRVALDAAQDEAGRRGHA